MRRQGRNDQIKGKEQLEDGKERPEEEKERLSQGTQRFRDRATSKEEGTTSSSSKHNQPTRRMVVVVLGGDKVIFVLCTANQTVRYKVVSSRCRVIPVLTSHQRLLSLGDCRHTVSPLRPLKLPEMIFLHADLGAWRPLSLASSSLCSSCPLSMSESSSAESSSAAEAGMGILAEGLSLVVSAARSCTSAEVSSPSSVWSSALLPLARKLRTTSYKQEMSVRSRVHA